MGNEANQIILAFEKLDNALSALEQMVNKPMEADRSNIDACIQRFEFSIELYWKLLKRILDSEGVEVQFPKEVLQEAYKGNLIDDETLWLQMLKDRNLSSHTYNQALADEIYERIQSYYPLMKETFKELSKDYWPKP